jgi:hypothetical protein
LSSLFIRHILLPWFFRGVYIALIPTSPLFSFDYDYFPLSTPRTFFVIQGKYLLVYSKEYGQLIRVETGASVDKKKTIKAI